MAASFYTLCAALSHAVLAMACPEIIDLGYARYRGIINATSGTTSFYSLPFAAPPTGNLRWQPPVPIENSSIYNGSLLLDATAPGAACVETNPQWGVELVAGLRAGRIGSPLARAALAISGENQTQSEDCLRLDVIVPNNPKSPRLPVAVMIHGGAYVGGSSLSANGNAFVSESNGAVIYVAIQYRLGPYGFLSSHEIKQDGTANAGLLDQRLALEWVQRHISAFGGDPAKVTIWGGSAGGGSAALQMMLHGGAVHPPFRGVIAEYPGFAPFHNPDTQEAAYHDLLTLTHCSNLKCLRAVPPERLANASQEAFAVGYAAGRYGYGDPYLTPTVDGSIIREIPSKAFQLGHFSKIPVISDREAYEGLLFTNFSINKENQVLRDVQSFWPNVDPTSPYFTDLMTLYPKSDFMVLLDPILGVYGALFPQTLLNPPFYQRAAIIGDAIINCPSYYIASGVANAGVPAWKMRFAAGLETHGSAASFTQQDSADSGNRALARQLKDYFISFITTLDPNAVATVSKPAWPRYQPGSNQILHVDQLTVGANMDPDAAGRCEFFQSRNRYSLI